MGRLTKERWKGLSGVGSDRNDAATAGRRLVNAVAAAAHKVKGDFDKVVCRIAFVVVHHPRHASHSVVVERSARSAKLFVDFKVDFSVLVVPGSGNNLECLIKAIRQERGAINVLLEIGSDGNSQASSDNHAVGEATAAEKIKLGIAIIESNAGSSSSLERIESGSTANRESGARLSDDRTGGAGDGANTQDNVLALNQFSRMEEHCLKKTKEGENG